MSLPSSRRSSAMPTNSSRLWESVFLAASALPAARSSSARMASISA